MSASENLLLAIEYAHLTPEDSADLFEALRVFCIDAGRTDLAWKAADLEGMFGNDAIEDSYEEGLDEGKEKAEEVIEDLEDKLTKATSALRKARAKAKKEKAKAKVEKCCDDPKIVKGKKTGKRRCKNCNTAWI